MSDARDVVAVLNNWNVVKNLSVVPFPYIIADANEYLKKITTEMKKKDRKNFVLTIEIDGKVSGAIGIHSIVRGHKAEMGYWLAEPYWGRGIMSEVLKKFVPLAFKNFSLRRIYAKAYSFNKGSQRVLEKAGFAQEGMEKKGILKNGKFIDAYLYAKVR